MNNEKNILGTEKIDKLLFKMSMPAVIGMVVNALYNVVDTIFIARGVGTDAIGGLSIAFPIQILIMAFGMLFGSGAASLISRSLGAGDKERANKSAGNSLVMGFIVGLAIMIPAMIFINPLLKIFGATESLLPYSREYLKVVLLGAPLLVFTMVGNNVARAEGSAKIAMVSMIIGTGMNIILDPIFIFVFKMGIQGAAIATVISQLLSFLFLLNFFTKGKSALYLTRSTIVLKASIIGSVVSLGLSSFVRQAGGSFIAIVLNNILGTYGGDIAISAFGVINRLLIFGLMPIFGIGLGFQPIAGYNYGAKQYDRLWEVLKHSILYSSILCVLYSTIIFVFPEFMISIFSSDKELVAFASDAIIYVVMMMPLIGVQVIGSMLFLAIGKVVPSFILGLSRQIILLLPLALILPKFLGLQGLWYAFPIADFTAVLITVVWMLVEIKKMKKDNTTVLT